MDESVGDNPININIILDNHLTRPLKPPPVV